MNIGTRPPTPAPFEGIDLPGFTLTSSTLTDGAPMPEVATARGGSLSPDLAWEVPGGHGKLHTDLLRPGRPDPLGLVALGDPGYPVSMTHLDEGAGAPTWPSTVPRSTCAAMRARPPTSVPRHPSVTAHTATFSRCTPSTWTPWASMTTRPPPWPRSRRSSTRLRAPP